MERARTVLSGPDEAAAVHRGEMSIHQAAKDARAKRMAVKPSSKKKVLSTEDQRANKGAMK